MRCPFNRGNLSRMLVGGLTVARRCRQRTLGWPTRAARRLRGASAVGAGLPGARIRCVIHRVTIRHHTFMRIFINPRQASHHPRDEIFRGNRVPCFETPSRAMFVEQALRARGHVLHAPDVDSAVVLARCTQRVISNFCAARGINGWRWAPPMPMSNPSPPPGRCAPCAAMSSRRTSPPS